MKILHTSDLHLGMKFATYDGAVREALVEARFACLSRLVKVANEAKCDLFVVAGDLFDRVDVARRDIIRAARTLGEFQGQVVAVLPGNHDHIAPDGSGVWPVFRENGGDNLQILERQEPVDLACHNLPVVLYPGPCTSKHSKENAIGWVRGVTLRHDVPHHIGVAHGSVEGISPDFAKDYHPMTPAELRGAPVRLWLLGHTHVRYPQVPGNDERIFFAGTPEPDGFDCDHAGTAWMHELGGNGEVRSTPLTTGEHVFRHDDVRLAGQGDLDSLARRYATPGSGKHLVKVRLSGRLPGEALARLTEMQQVVEKQVFWLKWDASGVTRQITAADIDAGFTTGSFPHRLLKKLAEKEEDVGALQEAHGIIQEVRR